MLIRNHVVFGLSLLSIATTDGLTVRLVPAVFILGAILYALAWKGNKSVRSKEESKTSLLYYKLFLLLVVVLLLGRVFSVKGEIYFTFIWSLFVIGGLSNLRDRNDVSFGDKELQMLRKPLLRAMVVVFVGILLAVLLGVLGHSVSKWVIIFVGIVGFVSFLAFPFYYLVKVFRA